jgi:hypothetical protein
MSTSEQTSTSELWRCYRLENPALDGQGAIKVVVDGRLERLDDKADDRDSLKAIDSFITALNSGESVSFLKT